MQSVEVRKMSLFAEIDNKTLLRASLVCLGFLFPLISGAGETPLIDRDTQEVLMYGAAALWTTAVPYTGYQGVRALSALNDSEDPTRDWRFARDRNHRLSLIDRVELAVQSGDGDQIRAVSRNQMSEEVKIDGKDGPLKRGRKIKSAIERLKEKSDQPLESVRRTSNSGIASARAGKHVIRMIGGVGAMALSLGTQILVITDPSQEDVLGWVKMDKAPAPTAGNSTR
jgi:hypothetical protein